MKIRPMVFEDTNCQYGSLIDFNGVSIHASRQILAVTNYITTMPQNYIQFEAITQAFEKLLPETIITEIERWTSMLDITFITSRAIELDEQRYTTTELIEEFNTKDDSLGVMNTGHLFKATIVIPKSINRTGVTISEGGLGRSITWEQWELLPKVK